MTAFVSLIRGINVGGSRLIRMDALRRLHESLGLKHVKSHLQSGNVVFESSGKSATIAKRLEDAIEVEVGFRPAVVLRTAAEMRDVMAHNPFPHEAESDPSHLLVMFLAGRPHKDAAARIAEAHVGPEQVRIAGEEVYLTYPAGIARSKLTNALLEKHLGTVGTARNWKTVAKLREMAEALEKPS